MITKLTRLLALAVILLTALTTAGCTLFQSPSPSPVSKSFIMEPLKGSALPAGIVVADGKLTCDPATMVAIPVQYTEIKNQGSPTVQLDGDTSLTWVFGKSSATLNISNTTQGKALPVYPAAIVAGANGAIAVPLQDPQGVKNVSYTAGFAKGDPFGSIAPARNATVCRIADPNAPKG